MTPYRIIYINNYDVGIEDLPTPIITLLLLLLLLLLLMFVVAVMHVFMVC